MCKVDWTIERQTREHEEEETESESESESERSTDTWYIIDNDQSFAELPTFWILLYAYKEVMSSMVLEWNLSPSGSKYIIDFELIWVN